MQDHENNVFDIDLINEPTKPYVTLAGEVEGLKPVAVAMNSIEPRLFTISRSAEALEVVSDRLAFLCVGYCLIDR